MGMADAILPDEGTKICEKKKSHVTVAFHDMSD